MFALLTSPITSPTASLVHESVTATMGYTRTSSLKVVIELWKHAFRMTELLGSIVCKMKLTTCRSDALSQKFMLQCFKTNKQYEFKSIGEERNTSKSYVSVRTDDSLSKNKNQSTPE